MRSFEKLYELQKLSGIKEKKKFIRENAADEDFKTLLFYALNPMLTYNISEERLRKEIEKLESMGGKTREYVEYPFTNIVECLDYLSGLRGMDDSTVRHTAMFLSRAYEKSARDLYVQIIAKTLQWRAGNISGWAADCQKRKSIHGVGAYHRQADGSVRP